MTTTSDDGGIKLMFDTQVTIGKLPSPLFYSPCEVQVNLGKDSNQILRFYFRVHKPIKIKFRLWFYDLRIFENQIFENF